MLQVVLDSVALTSLQFPRIEYGTPTLNYKVTLCPFSEKKGGGIYFVYKEMFNFMPNNKKISIIITELRGPIQVLGFDMKRR